MSDSACASGDKCTHSSKVRNMYSQNLGRDEFQQSHQELGITDSMLRLGLDSSESYPERYGVSDCVYYMRTGFCGYGSRCRYNHPRNRAAVEAAVRFTGDYPERIGEPFCQFYLQTGTCKFGASCKFHHPKHGVGSTSEVSLNNHGYPLRPGESECSYYLKTGQCKFGISCKFHHPPHAGMSGSELTKPAPQFYELPQSPSFSIPEQYGSDSTSLRVARPQFLPRPYTQGTYTPMLFSPRIVPIQGWNPYSPYSASESPVISPSSQTRVGASFVYSRATPYLSLPSAAGPSRSGSSHAAHVFPERPGELECQYYMKTGDCKFGSSCMYHHPRVRAAPRPDCILGPHGFPLRPGVLPCSFYMQNGHCKFASTCKFDHPMITLRSSPSVASLGSLVATPGFFLPSVNRRAEPISKAQN